MRSSLAVGLQRVRQTILQTITPLSTRVGMPGNQDLLKIQQALFSLETEPIGIP